MRLAFRLLLAAAGTVLPAAIALAACGTDAVGVDACRQIETKRCELAPVCPGFDPANVDKCKLFYRDECLAGLENANDGGNPDDLLVQGCLAELQRVANCASSGKSLASCNIEVLVPLADGGDAGAFALTPCSVLTATPELLKLCNFVAAPDAGLAPGSDASSVYVGDGGVAPF